MNLNALSYAVSFFFFFSYLLTYLAAPRGLSCGKVRSFPFGKKTLSWGIWDSVPQSRIEHGSPALGAWSLNRWTTREIPPYILIFPLGKQSYMAGWWNINHSCVHRRDGSPGDLAKMTICFQPEPTLQATHTIDNHQEKNLMELQMNLESQWTEW